MKSLEVLALGLENKTVCVTGASGFIASWIVAKLLHKGYTVHGTVRNPDDGSKCDHLRNLEGASERLKLFKADVLDPHSLVEPLRGCSGVFHTACPVKVKFEDPHDVLDAAIEGTRNVLKACADEKIKRVVMTSSGSAVIVDKKRPADKVVDETCWSDAQACREAEDWYSVAKTESEQEAWSLAEKYKLDLVVICPVMVFGPILQPSMNYSIEYLLNIMNGTRYPNSWNRVVDVRDVAEAHVAALENPSASGRYYCFAETLLHKTIVEILKKRFPDHSYPEKCDRDIAGGTPPSMASNEKTKKDLIPSFIPVEETLGDTVFCLQEKKLI